MNIAWNQPIHPKLMRVISPDEQIICSFKGSWIDYGFFDGKTRDGMWVITDKFIHFRGMVDAWNIGTEFGSEIRRIPFENIRNIVFKGKKIKIYFIKDVLKPHKISERGMYIKRFKGESKIDAAYRREEIFKLIQRSISSIGTPPPMGFPPPIAYTPPTEPTPPSIPPPPIEPPPPKKSTTKKRTVKPKKRKKRTTKTKKY